MAKPAHFITGRICPEASGRVAVAADLTQSSQLTIHCLPDSGECVLIFTAHEVSEAKLVT